MPLQPLVRLGRTNLIVPQLGFGALPIQRTPMDRAIPILRRAFEAGIRFFDTARGYSDSEEKLGRALSEVRAQIVIATKTGATDAATARQHLETSLCNLQTSYVDIIQLHNAESVPNPNDERTAYAALAQARRQGLVRHLGITCHRLDVAIEAASSGLFDTVQFPISHISSPRDLALIDRCRANNVGFIAMKALCGGLLTNIPAAFAFFRQLPDVVPIWGIQHLHELEQLLELQRRPPELNADLQRAIDRDRAELAGSFCHGCGYCQPCPVGIPISWAARMSFLLRRAPYQQFLAPKWRADMERIADCTGCRKCAERCPYQLDTPELLRAMLADYRQFAASHDG